MKNDVEVIKSSGNVFADLGLPNPEEDYIKAQLTAKIQEFINQKGMTQARVAVLIGVDQPKVSNLLRGRFSGFSVERLFEILNKLGHKVEVRISVKEYAPEKARTSVATCR
jgi:predicted XRE-type DNA-binding protein